MGYVQYSKEFERATESVESVLATAFAGLVLRVARRLEDRALDYVAEQVWLLAKRYLGDRITRDLENRSLSEADDEQWQQLLRKRLNSVMVDNRQVVVLINHLVTAYYESWTYQLAPDLPDFADRIGELSKLLEALDRDPASSRAASEDSGWSSKQLGKVGELNELLDEVDEELEERDREEFVQGLRLRRTTVPTVVIEGAPQIGKSALAVHLAHKLRSRYHDGQLVVDLERSDDVQAQLMDLLRAQGVPLRELPETQKLALARYRSWFVGKRALVVIENAADAEQVRLFLPPEENCAAIVTSRRPLGELAADARCQLAPLTQDDAVDFLREVDRSSRGWTAGDPQAVEIVSRLCGGEPAVIRELGAWMSELGHDLSLEQITQRMDSEQPWDDAFQDARLWRVFQLRYKTLSERSSQAARIFRLLGMLHIPHVETAVVAALADLPHDSAEQAIHLLAGTRLLTEDRDGASFPSELHQRFASSRARAEERSEEIRKALERALRHYLIQADVSSTKAAARVLDDIARVEQKRRTLVAAIMQAFNEGFYDLAWRLSVRSAKFFEAHGYFHAWLRTAEIGVRAAERLDREDRLQALARTQWNLGNAYRAQRRREKAIEQYQRSLSSAHELTRLGLAHWQQKGSARDQAGRCLQMVQELDEQLKFEQLARQYPGGLQQMQAEFRTNVKKLSKKIERYQWRKQLFR